MFLAFLPKSISNELFSPLSKQMDASSSDFINDKTTHLNVRPIDLLVMGQTLWVVDLFFWILDILDMVQITFKSFYNLLTGNLCLKNHIKWVSLMVAIQIHEHKTKYEHIILYQDNFNSKQKTGFKLRDDIYLKHFLLRKINTERVVRDFKVKI